CLQRCNQRASIDDFTEHLFLRQYTRTLLTKFLEGDDNRYWFTNWHEVDLLNALERKELKQVY
ncbi:hypothetical protein A256_24698, partial [Pseudomonas syringae pv. actinidiae ICMP 19103]|uniref:hypothetical protein n=1 Tax=Pseudomonas syringae TaxID=317 RepID=UPI00035526CB